MPIRLQLGDTLVEAEVFFLSASDVGTIASLKLTGALISGDVDESVLNALRASVGLYPDAPTHSGIILEGLYPEASGWLQSLIHSKPPGMAVFAQPAANTLEVENLDNLPAGYYDRLISDNPPDWLSRNIHPPPSQMIHSIEIIFNFSLEDPPPPPSLIATIGGEFVVTEYELQRRLFSLPRKEIPKHDDAPAEPTTTLAEMKPEPTTAPEPEAPAPNFRDVGQYRRGRVKPINI